MADNHRMHAQCPTAPTRRFVLLALALVAVALVAHTLTLAKQSEPVERSSVLSAARWSDLVRSYLESREGLWPLVVSASSSERQNDPDWYWTFDQGMRLIAPKSEIARALPQGGDVVIYEDILADEILVMADTGKGYEPVASFTPPDWPKAVADSEQILTAEMAKRRILWTLTLVTELPAEPMLMRAMGWEGGSVTAIQVASAVPGSNGMITTVAYPDGYTNRLDIFYCSVLACPSDQMMRPA